MHLGQIVNDQVNDLASTARPENPPADCTAGIGRMLGLAIPWSQFQYGQHLGIRLQHFNRQRIDLREGLVRGNYAIHLPAQPTIDHRPHVFDRAGAGIVPGPHDLLGLGQHPVIRTRVSHLCIR
jgi:hypothetical protein